LCPLAALFPQDEFFFVNKELIRKNNTSFRDKNATFGEKRGTPIVISNGKSLSHNIIGEREYILRRVGRRFSVLYHWGKETGCSFLVSQREETRKIPEYMFKGRTADWLKKYFSI